MPSSTSSSSRRWLFALAVLAAVFAADRAGSWLLTELIGASEHRLTRPYRGGLEADILIVGNSRAFHGIDESVLARDSCRGVHNLSANALGARAASFLILDYLERNAAPKVVLIEASNLVLGNQALRPQRLIGALSPRFARLLSETRTSLLPWGELFHLSRFQGELLPRVILALGGADRRPPPLPPVSPERLAWALAQSGLPLAETPPERIQVFTESLNAIAASGARPLLFIAPFHPMLLGHGPEVVERLAALPGLLPEGVELKDYSRAMAKPELFADESHLTAEGAARFTQLLLQDAGGLLSGC